MLPRWLYVPAAVGAAFVLLPLVAIVARVDWADFGALITSEASQDALWLSLRTSALSTLLCVLFGMPMAVVLARTSFPGQGVLRSLVLLPLVLPPVVGGIALLYTFGRRGLLGEQLDVLGIQVAFSTTAVVLAQTFVAMPFLVVSLEGALRTAGQRYEVVAASLGAAPTTVLPPGHAAAGPARPGLRSGARLRPGARASSARRSRSPAACRASPARCRWRSTSSARPTSDAAVALSLVLVVVAVLVIGFARQGRSSV